jgi:Tfp pilus assembly PilM family ATPase
MLQLVPSGAGVRVGGAIRAPFPPDVQSDPDARLAFVAQCVRDALRCGLLRGRRFVAAVPKELLHYKTHRLPPMSGDDLPLAAKIDARDLFRFDPDSVEVRCADAGDVRHTHAQQPRMREVILVAAGRQYIDRFVRAIHGAGARLESLEIDPCALWRAAARVSPDPLGAGAAANAHPRAILDVGAAESRLVIAHDGTIRVVRTIDVGGDRIRTAISRKLGLTAEETDQLRRRIATNPAEKLENMRKVVGDAARHATETLAREVLAAVRYHAVTFGGPSPRRIEIVGGEAGDPQVRSALSATLLLPAKPADLYRGIDTSAIPAAADRTTHLGEWAVALGLALKGHGAVLTFAPAETPTTFRAPPAVTAVTPAGGAA